MKICILTQPLHNNYGGILQNFALQQILKKLGHQVITINPTTVYPTFTKFQFYTTLIKRTVKKILRHPYVEYINPIKHFKIYSVPGEEQSRFLNQYIHYENHDFPLTQSFFSQNSCDAIIVGSDQVWRPLYSSCISNYFLDFVDTQSIKKISYAASFGVDVSEFSRKEETRFAKLLKKFDGISVREISGINLCKNIFDCSEVEHVLDPTLLLNDVDYIDLIDKKSSYNNIDNNNLLVVYLLDYKPSKIKIINKIAKENQLSVRYIGQERFGKFQSIESWLSEIHNAKAIITDSFHGTIFSLLFNKQFLTIQNSSRGNSRFASLVELFDLQNNFTDENFDQNIIPQIEYSVINKKISFFKEKSIDFLKKHLV